MAGFCQNWPCMTGYIQPSRCALISTFVWPTGPDFGSWKTTYPTILFGGCKHRMWLDMHRYDQIFWGPSHLNSPQASRQIIRQPTEWCSGQTAPSQPPLHCTILTNLTAASCHLLGAMCKGHIHALPAPNDLSPKRWSIVSVIDIISTSHWIESMRRLTTRKIEEFALISWLRSNSWTAEKDPGRPEARNISNQATQTPKHQSIKSRIQTMIQSMIKGTV